MKIISWNVNGIRSVFKKGFVEWFTKESPDILCLQEIKADRAQFPDELETLKDYQLEVSSAIKKGYSGVATFSRQKILDTRKMGIAPYDDEGRVLIHEYKDFFLLNCYFPNGQRDHNRVPFKMKFCHDILILIEKLKEKKGVIITGDFNTAHFEIDLANPKSNIKTTGFLPIERAWMDELTQKGWIDTYRLLNPNQTGAYSWWSNRPGCRERNIGWRIDYFFIDPKLESKIKNVAIYSGILGSDHCPIVLELK